MRNVGGSLMRFCCECGMILEEDYNVCERCGRFDFSEM